VPALSTRIHNHHCDRIVGKYPPADSEQKRLVRRVQKQRSTNIHLRPS
jgi:hypothetical protein